MDMYFRAAAIGPGLPLCWFAYTATKRMRIGNNLEWDEQPASDQTLTQAQC